MLGCGRRLLVGRCPDGSRKIWAPKQGVSWQWQLSGKIDTTVKAKVYDFFDFAVNEQCRQYRECGRYRPFLRAGKAVFHAEYALTTAQFCPRSQALGLSSIRKKLNLGVWRQTCPVP